jgi:LacI family transcriptional regulator
MFINIIKEFNSMNSIKKVSLREIARMCNVSPATVSRIANGTGSFSDDTKKLVLNTMVREGYSIDLDTGSEDKSKRFIGCLIPDFTNELFTDRLNAINRYFHQKDIDVLVLETNGSEDQESKSIKMLYQMGAIGILSFAGHELHGYNIPIPIICMDLPQNFKDEKNVYYISSDDFVGGQLAAHELYRKGCTNPLILNIRYSPVSGNQRILGFIRAYEENGIHIDNERIIQPEHEKSSFLSAKDLISYHRAKGTPFDSIFACSDWRAYGAIVALRNMNIEIPREVKVVGYDGIRISKHCELPFTTIKQDTATLAQTACDTLWKLINKEPVTNHQILIPIYLQEGKTT